MSIEAITLAKRVEGLIPRDRFVLFVLADYANDDLEAWPRQATIASDTGYSRATVNRALQSLEERGVLTSLQEQRGDGGNSTKRYRLNLHNLHPPVKSVYRPLSTADTPPVKSVYRPLSNLSTASNKEELPRKNYQKNLTPPYIPPQGGSISREGDSDPTRRVRPHPEPPSQVGKPLLEPSLTQTSRPVESLKVPDPARPRPRPAKDARTDSPGPPGFDPSLVDLPANVPRAGWIAWTEHRREIGKPLTERAAKLALEELRKAGDRAAELIERGIQCRWTGLKAAWLRSSQPPRDGDSTALRAQTRQALEAAERPAEPPIPDEEWDQTLSAIQNPAIARMAREGRSLLRRDPRRSSRVDSSTT